MLNHKDLHKGTRITVEAEVIQRFDTAVTIKLKGTEHQLVLAPSSLSDATIISQPPKQVTVDEVELQRLRAIEKTMLEKELKEKVERSAFGSTFGEALKNLEKNNKGSIQPCLHGQCSACHGTGHRPFGGPCIHMISCKCPKCTPMMFQDTDKEFYKSLEQPKTHTLYSFPKSIAKKIDIWLGL